MRGCEGGREGGVRGCEGAGGLWGRGVAHVFTWLAVMVVRPGH